MHDAGAEPPHEAVPGHLPALRGGAVGERGAAAAGRQHGVLPEHGAGDDQLVHHLSGRHRRHQGGRVPDHAHHHARRPLRHQHHAAQGHPGGHPADHAVPHHGRGRQARPRHLHAPRRRPVADPAPLPRALPPGRDPSGLLRCLLGGLLLRSSHDVRLWHPPLPHVVQLGHVLVAHGALPPVHHLHRHPRAAHDGRGRGGHRGDPGHLLRAHPRHLCERQDGLHNHGRLLPGVDQGLRPHDAERRCYERLVHQHGPRQPHGGAGVIEPGAGRVVGVLLLHTGAHLRHHHHQRRHVTAGAHAAGLQHRHGRPRGHQQPLHAHDQRGVARRGPVLRQRAGPARRVPRQRPARHQPHEGADLRGGPGPVRQPHQRGAGCVAGHRVQAAPGADAVLQQRPHHVRRHDDHQQLPHGRGQHGHLHHRCVVARRGLPRAVHHRLHPQQRQQQQLLLRADRHQVRDKRREHVVDHRHRQRQPHRRLHGRWRRPGLQRERRTHHLPQAGEWRSL